MTTAKELAKEIFDLTEELRLAQPMIRWDKKEEAIAYWENKILEVAEALNKPIDTKSVCDEKSVIKVIEDLMTEYQIYKAKKEKNKH